MAADWSALLVAVVWQSTLLAAVVAVVAWLLRRSTPTIRYWFEPAFVAIKILFRAAVDVGRAAGLVS